MEVSYQFSWAQETAGGSNCYPSFCFNPQIIIYQYKPCTINISLQQLAEVPPYAVGLFVYRTKGEVEPPIMGLSDRDIVIKPDVYRAARNLSSAFNLEPSQTPYLMIPSTVQPQSEGTFIITFQCADPTAVTIQPVSQRHHRVVIPWEWTLTTSGGCVNNKTFFNNPQFLFSVPPGDKPIELHMSLIQLNTSNSPSPDQCGLYVINYRQDDENRIYELPKENLISKSSFSSHLGASTTNVYVPPSSKFLIVPCTFDPGYPNSFQLIVWSSEPLVAMPLL